MKKFKQPYIQKIKEDEKFIKDNSFQGQFDDFEKELHDLRDTIYCGIGIHSLISIIDNILIKGVVRTGLYITRMIFALCFMVFLATLVYYGIAFKNQEIVLEILIRTFAIGLPNLIFSFAFENQEIE